MFADDITTVEIGTNLEEVKNRTDLTHSHLQTWFINNRLTLNNEKTVKCLFTLRPVPISTDPEYVKICIDNVFINFSSKTEQYTKFLPFSDHNGYCLLYTSDAADD